MNKEKVLQLAARIEQSNRFSMMGCSTCIAGHTEEFDQDSYTPDSQQMRLSLDLTSEETQELFTPAHTYADWSAGYGDHAQYITREHAGAVLRHFAETGEVDWRVGKEKR